LLSLPDSHIEHRLGLGIDPREVRLIPYPTDPYGWSYLPERQHLFLKQLSKHNIGAYREICRELGTSIEVVAVGPQLHEQTSAANPVSDEGQTPVYIEGKDPVVSVSHAQHE